MPVTVSGYAFEGPYYDTGALQEKGGVYVIVTSRNNQHTVVDVGESGGIKSRIEGHDRKGCWTSNANGGTIGVLVLYLPGYDQAARMKIEKEIRDKYNPPCGKV